MPTKVADFLEEFPNIVSDHVHDGLQLVQKISHQMDLILGASFLNKAAHRMQLAESEELNRQVNKLLQKGLIQESLRRMENGGCAQILELSTRSQSSTDSHCQGCMILWTV